MKQKPRFKDHESAMVVCSDVDLAIRRTVSDMETYFQKYPHRRIYLHSSLQGRIPHGGRVESTLGHYPSSPKLNSIFRVGRAGNKITQLIEEFCK
jgi:hypothetical protein